MINEYFSASLVTITPSSINKRMKPKSQNLFLFFEDYETKNIIDRKLVKMYMNRCIIKEDEYFEICGVYELQFVEDRMLSHQNPLYETSEKQRAIKETVDSGIFFEAVKHALLLETDFSDNHFIIGSSFYRETKNMTILSYENLSPDDLVDISDSKSFDCPVKDYSETLQNWLLSSMIFLQIQSIYVTVLAGNRYNLMTQDMHKCVYDGWNSALYANMLPNSMAKCLNSQLCRATFKPSKIPIYDNVFPANDDFELAIELIRNGRRLKQNMVLFLHPTLNPYQMKLKTEKNESFMRSFTGHRSYRMKRHQTNGSIFFQKIFGNENEYMKTDMAFDDPDLTFVKSICLRQSYHLKLY